MATGRREKSDHLLEMIPLKGRTHTCEGGARSRDLSSVCPTHRTFLLSQRRGSTDSNDPISPDASDSLRETMVIIALQVRSRGSWTLLPTGNLGVKSRVISPEEAGLGERAAEFCSCSVAKAWPILCYRMDCSMPGIPVLHRLLEFAQTHVHWVSDAIQPSHPLSLPSPLAFNLSQHQGLFQIISSSHQVAKLVELQLQSFQWIFRVDLL